MVMLDSAHTSVQSAPTVAEHGDSTTGLVWEAVEGVQPAAWVGRVHGSFVGMVEARWQEGFTATTRLGRKLGTFGTLQDAQGAFVVRRH
jgi:hypothetical protein